MFLGAPMILFSLILLGGCGPGKYKAKPNEELYGTWINESYGIVNAATYFPQKMIVDSSGYTGYRNISDHGAQGKGPEQIASKWTDSEGNIWYRTFGTGSNGDKVIKWQELNKLSKSGTIREYVSVVVSDFDSGKYPTKIDSNDPSYHICNRAQE
jgi:hypothetical protein